MAERAGFAAAPPPDFYLAAMGRSGSTMLCNWLSHPPERIVFNEPFFLRPGNCRLLRIQLASLGMPVSDEEWAAADENPGERFRGIMAPRLEGRRWAAKEVLCEEHFAMTEVFAPPRVLVSVRNIVDVALSLFEKHRVQNNLDRFSDEWVQNYCTHESAGLVDYLRSLESAAIPCRVVRYEDFTASAGERKEVARFAGWPGEGDVAANIDRYGRGFELERHGTDVGAPVGGGDRDLPAEAFAAADAIAEQCSPYQRRFGYA